MSNYRVVVSYDPERSVFVARAPELEHCSAEGATRTEAVAKVDEEIDAQLRNIREHGGRPPAPVDEDGGAAFTGDIAAKVSRGLHRDLVWQARSEGVELSQLVGEMLAGALDARRQRRRPPQNLQQQAGERQERSEGEPRPGGGGGGGGQRPFRPSDRGQGGGGRYHAIMEDRATFLEYVRGLESGGPGRGQGGPGGGGGGPGGGGRRRGRGRFGGPPDAPREPAKPTSDANSDDGDEGGKK